MEGAVHTTVMMTTRRNQEACLRRILRQRFPRDVLMPCRKGSKAPLFAHALGCWTWERYEDFILARTKKKKKSKTDENNDWDLCIILSDLCVVDVDGGPSAVARFERENADCLRGQGTTPPPPRVDTTNGRHYWFVRPAVADELGYFDGPAQRAKGVDFKSVCRTGTGGVVSVPPSTGKTWVFEVLNGGDVPEMPLALLDRVARPRHLVPTSRQLSLAFEDKIMTVRAEKHVQRMSYLEPFLQDDDAATGIATSVIPVPCRSDLFFELLHVIDRRELSGALPPSRDLLRGLAHAARLLGCPDQERVVRDLAVGVPQAQAAVADMFPEWWEAHVRERAELDADLIDLDGNIGVTYSPEEPPAHRRDERLLPAIYARAPERRPHGMAAGDRLLPREGAAHALLRGDRRVDARVIAAMRAVPGHVVLAGGAVLDALMGGEKRRARSLSLPRASDYDLFLVGIEDDAACFAALCDVRKALTGEDGSASSTTKYAAARTGCSYTFVLKGDAAAAAADGAAVAKKRKGLRGRVVPSLPSSSGRPLPASSGSAGTVVVQVILRKTARISQLLSWFDASPCKAAAAWRGDEQRVQVLCAPTWLPCMRRMAFPVDLGRWGAASPLRTFKYLCKGFEVYLPGLSREATERTLTRRHAIDGKIQPLVFRSSILEVLRVERMLAPVLRVDPGVDLVEEPSWSDLERVKDVLKSNYLSSDYESTTSTTGTLVHVVAEMLRQGYVWLKERPAASRLLRRNDVESARNATGIDDMKEYVWPSYASSLPIMRPASSMWHLVAANKPPTDDVDDDGDFEPIG